MDENDNTPYLSSLELSKVLGKRHDHVLRDIEVEQESVENIFKRCSDDQMLSNLARKFLIGLKESSYVDTKGRTQTGNPFELSLAYCSSVCHNAFEIEAEIHKVLAGFHIRGEWFSATPDKAIEEINKLVS